MYIATNVTAFQVHEQGNDAAVANSSLPYVLRPTLSVFSCLVFFLRPSAFDFAHLLRPKSR
jgi:hypothetical protein